MDTSGLAPEELGSLKSFIFLAAFLGSISLAHALSPNDICNSVSTNSSKIDCLDVATKCQSYSQEALYVCDSLSTNSSKIECLSHIANRRFQSVAVRVCSSLSTNSSRIDCLDTISEKNYEPNIIATCQSLSTNSSRIKCLDRFSGSLCNQENGSCVR